MSRASLRPPRGFVALLGAVLCVAGVRPAAAQKGCEFGEGSGTFNQVAIPNGGFIIRVAHPHLVCKDGAELWSDSTVTFTAQHVSHLMGHVRFRDEARVMRADDALYHSDTSVLTAFGHLFVQDTARGSIIRNGKLDYRRKTSTRPSEQMTVVIGSDLVRPVALLRIRPVQDSTGTAAAAPGPARTIEPDAPGAGSDSTRAAVPDTVVKPDTTHAAVPDTAVKPDTAQAVVQDTSRAAKPDTTHAVAPDTTRRAKPDTTHAMVPDSAKTGPPPLVKGRVPSTGEAGEPGAPPGAPPVPDTARTTEPPDTTPYVVKADRLLLQGESYFRATGSVNIDRDSLHAFADTAVYDQAGGRILLKAFAKVQSSGYDLSGDRVNISVPDGRMRQVRAIHEAKLTGNQLNMTAPVITVFLTDGQMDRLVATPMRGDAADTVSLAPPEAPDAGSSLARRMSLLHTVADSGRTAAPDSADEARPVASSEKFRLTADSLDVRAPGQVLDKMYAVGQARGESSAGDSLNVPSLPEIARKDWITGDTLIATFVKVQPKPDQPRDSAHYDLDRLVAQGNAHSLYRIAPSDSTSRPGIDPPAVHYVLGKEITIVLDSGQVDHMEVVDPKGWHLEPLTRAARDSAAADSTAQADSTKAKAPPDTAQARPGLLDKLQGRPDSTKARPDTTKTRPDTMKARPATEKVRPDTTKPLPGRPGNAKVHPDTMVAVAAGGWEWDQSRRRQR